MTDDTQDMREFLGVFLDEATEQIAVLEGAILDLEQSASTELLQEIFRAAHTLKGSSRAMGFSEMGTLTHVMEDVFDKLRRSELTVTADLVDALLDGLDSLKSMTAEIASGGEGTLDTSHVTARLRAALEGNVQPPLHETAIPASPVSSASWATPVIAASVAAQLAISEARAAGCEVVLATVRLAPDCAMKSVRALMVMQALENKAAILDCSPDEESLENEQFDTDFTLLIATDNHPDTLRGVCLGIAEVLDVVVVPYGERSPDSCPLAAPAGANPAEPRYSTEETGIDPADDRRADLGRAARAMDGGTPLAIAKGGAGQSPTIRVDVSRLDNLMNLVGELVIDQTRIARLSGKLEDRFSTDPLIDQLREAAAHFGRITLEMQEEIMKARMLPIDHVFNRFPRMVRDLAQKLGKDVDLVIEGRETELDRSVIEVIADPLIHLLRNSVDHGIEDADGREAAGKPRNGTVWLRARHEENHIVIEVEDDGKGIDPWRLRAKAVEIGSMSPEAAARLSDREALNLIFGSGFSTAESVTDVSGRGVGMDIVKSNLTRTGAALDVSSTVGSGTTFTLKLPLTLAIIRGLLVTVASGVYAIPLATVVETIDVAASRIRLVSNREVILHRGSVLPLVRLGELFHGEAVVNRTAGPPASPIEPGQRERHSADGSPTYYVVVVRIRDQRVGLAVDSLLGEQEIAIKSLGNYIGVVPGVSGATILSDGSIALIVDVNGLLSGGVDQAAEPVAA